MIYEAPQVESFRSTSSGTIVIVAELENFGDDPRDFTGIVIYNNQGYPSLPDYFPDEQYIVDTSSNPDTIADPDVATLDNDPTALNSDQHGSNSYVVVYRRDAADGSFSDIRAILQNNFTGYVKEFTIKRSATGELSKPQVTHLNGGGFIVAWIDEYAPDQREVRLQRFDGDGNAVGSQLTFDNPQGRYIWDFDLETMANGRVLLTVSEGTDNRGIAYAIYNVDGNLITGTDNGETLTANSGDSILEGLGGSDTLIGLDGDDWMSGGTGTDSFDGGGGNDTVDFTYSNSDWTVNLLTGTAVAGSTTEALESIENVNTGGGDDTITGDNGINILKGNGGDDTIISGQGADDIDGGSGIDTADYENEWTGLALASFGTRTYDLEADQMVWADVTAPGSGGYIERMEGIENVIGSDFDETFIADLAANTFTGNGGNDTFKAHNALIYLSALKDIYLGMDGIDAADFGAITLASGHTSASRSFTITLTGNSTVALGSAVEDGGGTLATFLDIETIRGSSYDDTIIGNTVANQLNGGAGDDIISGGGGIDDLRGGNGDDTLAGGAGVDIFNGGNGSDTVDYSTTAGSATYDLAQQKFLGAITENWTSIENVNAGSGNDTLIGGTGINIMDGGAGDDVIHVNDAGDVVIEAAGQGNDRVVASLSYVLSSGAEVETLSVSNIFAFDEIDLTGNLLSQTIIGNLGNNLLNSGGPGGAADIMRGLGGNDTYRVNNSADVIEEGIGSGTDTVRTTASYTLASGVEVERLLALAPASTKAMDLTGNEFGQIIAGNAGANTLTGWDGDDILVGLDGADVIDGGDGIDTLDYSASGAGVKLAFNNGSATGGHGEGDVVSNMENVIGSIFGDTFTGNNGANFLDGDSGDDKLNGGSGQDQLAGGSGNDTFVFLSTTHSGAGETLRDTILDFAAGDLIDLSLIDAQEGSAATDEAFIFIPDTIFSGEGQIRASQVGADTIVYINTSGNGGTEMQIVLAGFAVGDLSAADFLL
ncbi:hypothetical protein [Aestuariivirga sp.]|uniref:hypothetical protein n=1 Tax=Aestuariivirga sp. TaxID=2650926 RepID=UPI00359422F4